jgi:hypothetical protein
MGHDHSRVACDRCISGGAEVRKRNRQTLAQEQAIIETIPSDATERDPGNDTERVSAVDVDPELERQLTLATDNETVEAVLVLRQSGADRQQPSDPRALLQRVSRDEPAGAVEHTVLPRLGVLIVRAHAHVIRRLIAQPVVATASANRRHRRMKLQIDHETILTYAQPVREAVGEARLRPRDEGGQHLIGFRLALDPLTPLNTVADRFGNTIHCYSVLPPHQCLVITATSIVETSAESLITASVLLPFQRHDFTTASPYAPCTGDLLAFARAHGPDSSDAEATAQALMGAIYQSCTYSQAARISRLPRTPCWPGGVASVRTSRTC